MTLLTLSSPRGLKYSRLLSFSSLCSNLVQTAVIGDFMYADEAAFVAEKSGQASAKTCCLEEACSDLGQQVSCEDTETMPSVMGSDNWWSLKTMN